MRWPDQHHPRERTSMGLQRGEGGGSNRAGIEYPA